MDKQVRAARTRQALIRAAAEMFADHGYALASLPAISKRAGVSAGTLHSHFSSKESLASAVESTAAYSLEELTARCRLSADTSLHTLALTTSSLLLAMAGDPVVRAAFKLSGDPSRKNGAKTLQWWQACVHDLFVQAKDAGELAEDASPEVATTVIVGVTVGFEALFCGPDRDWLLREFWTFILPRLAASPSVDSPPGPYGDSATQ